MPESESSDNRLTFSSLQSDENKNIKYAENRGMLLEVFWKDVRRDLHITCVEFEGQGSIAGLPEEA